MIHSPFVVSKSNSELSKNVSIHCKSREIFGPYNFLTTIKSSIPDVWNWNFWTFFGLEIQVELRRGGWGGMTSLHPLPRWLQHCTSTYHIIKNSKLQKHVFHHYKAWEWKPVSIFLLKKLKHQNKTRNRWHRTTWIKKKF